MDRSECANVLAETTAARKAGASGAPWIELVRMCAEACATCAEKCEKHADMHEHCRACAEACRRCEEACRELIDAVA